MEAVRDRRESLRILSFWWMLELFSPQQVPVVPREATQPADRQVIQWRPGDPLPWDTLPAARPLYNKQRVWQHTVFLGVYKLAASYKALEQFFGADPDAYDNRPNAESACAGIIVDNDGRLVTDSGILSSALWAAGRIRESGPNDSRWMDEFEDASKELMKSIDSLEGRRRQAGPDEPPPPLDSDSLVQLLELSHRAAGVNGFHGLADNRIVIQSVAVLPSRVDEEDTEGKGADFLNSFYLDDLATVRKHVALGNCGEGLTAYLTGDKVLPTSTRTDVIKQPDAVDAWTSIERLPKGRWPSNPQHSLALSQQFAVNRALNGLGRGAGLMGVNGPPGTGKTTMLRDILAGNVVERARRLAALEKPTDAFTKVTHRWNDRAGYPRKVRQLTPELTGFEMVVASANNAAVENVTTEIPEESAVDAPWRGHLDYFSEIATEVLRAGTSKTPSAWGLVAARLGKKSNRSAFLSSFWFDKKPSKNQEFDEDSVPRMQTRLKQWRDGDVAFTPWTDARQAFHIAEQRVDTLLRERAQAQHRLRRVRELPRRALELQSEVELASKHLKKAQSNLSQCQTHHEEREAVRAQAAESHGRHLAAKPGALETIFSFGQAIRDWRSHHDELLLELVETENSQREAAAVVQETEERVRQLGNHLSSARRELKSVQRNLAKLRAECAKDEERLGTAYPGPAWIGDERELHAPWLDEELNSARSDLFVAALQLHQDFLANAAREMLEGLRAASDVLSGNSPRDLDPGKIKAAWQHFFLVVPLISTTFASASRMFEGIGAEAIGWLLIDEAGQSSPQFAAGMIWRAQRTIAVGDPLQLEPVVTIPEKAQRHIAHSYGISTTWIPPRASVQTFADRVTPFGTFLDQGEEKSWVSAPLRVHRRCDDPMFSLCNQIAYNNLMVDGVYRDLASDQFDSPDKPVVAVSYWADEPASNPGSHYQPNQIRRLEKALVYLDSQGIPPSEIIVITPFRDVANKLQNLTRKYEGLRAGTIHTAQGREASVVILVLGGDPNKPGAPAYWARTPNLVNVAASRAKRRLYVIGDRRFWKQYNYFRDLSNALR